MKQLLFLDIDGVLNDHKRMPNGYCGVSIEGRDCLNFILDSLPELQLVISSAWRYIVTSDESTLKGFEHLLLTHGIKARGRVLGVTAIDPPEEAPPNLDNGHFDTEAWSALGLKWRCRQIADYLWDHCEKGDAWVCVDDLDLDIPGDRFVKTDGNVGMTIADAVNICQKIEAQL